MQNLLARRGVLCYTEIENNRMEGFPMEKKAFDLITFGEIMLRRSPPRHARIVDGDIF